MTHDHPMRSFRMEFDSLDLEFLVDISGSRAETFRRPIADPDFVFVVGRIALCRHSAESALISTFENENLGETVRNLEERARSASVISGVEQFIPRGRLTFWMHGYWERLYDDRSDRADERIYDLLFPFCAVAEDATYIAIYGYQGSPTIEITTRSSDGGDVVHAWSQFNSETTARDFENLRRSMTSAVNGSGQRRNA